MYVIRQESVRTFINDPEIRLPRFQRKQTWDDKKNFQLCISIFKNYPMGVCILSNDKEKGQTIKELLDGRQRRNVFSLINENPENIYFWAKKFLGFKNTSQIADIQDSFRTKIDEYLESDDDDLRGNSESSKEEPDEPIYPDSEEEIKSDDPFDGKEGMELLRNIIEMVHCPYRHGTGFTRPFDFSDYTSSLQYIQEVSSNNKYMMTGGGVKIFIDEYRDHFCRPSRKDYADVQNFIDFVILRGNVEKKHHSNLKKLINAKWKDILVRINLVKRVESVLSASQIGLIEVSNISPADSQKIFNIINSEGVKLTAAEILSAKPHWNRKIKAPTEETEKVVKELYGKMDLSLTDIVRWDLPATLLSHFGENIVFKKLSWEEKGEFDKKLTLGFKLLSGICENGIKKENIEKLATDPDINWEFGIERIISDLKKVIETIEAYPYFHFLKGWKSSIMELTSEAIALDFILISYLDWKRKGKPSGSNMQTKIFQKNCFITWDRLIYEYACRFWRGSSDSTIANNISALNNKPELFEPIKKDEWKKLLNEIHSRSEILGTDVSILTLKPILYHMYCLRTISAPDTKYAIEVDHIIPQALFNASSIERKKIVQDNLFNLGLLPKDENVSKSDKPLKLIGDSWLKSQIKIYEFIEKSDFDKFSDVSNYKDLFKKRKKYFDEAFDKYRDKLINN